MGCTWKMREAGQGGVRGPGTAEAEENAGGSRERGNGSLGGTQEIQGGTRENSGAGRELESPGRNEEEARELGENEKQTTKINGELKFRDQ